MCLDCILDIQNNYPGKVSPMNPLLYICYAGLNILYNLMTKVGGRTTDGSTTPYDYSLLEQLARMSYKGKQDMESSPWNVY